MRLIMGICLVWLAIIFLSVPVVADTEDNYANKELAEELDYYNQQVLDHFDKSVADYRLTGGEIYELITRLKAWQKFIRQRDHVVRNAQLADDQSVFGRYLRVEALLPFLDYNQPLIIHSDNNDIMQKAAVQASALTAKPILIEAVIKIGFPALVTIITIILVWFLTIMFSSRRSKLERFLALIFTIIMLYFFYLGLASYNWLFWY